VLFSFSLHVVDTVHAHLSARYCSLEQCQGDARTHTYFLTYKKCHFKISLFSINLSHLLSDLSTFSFFFHLYQFHSSLITLSLYFIFCFYSIIHSLTISLTLFPFQSFFLTSLNLCFSLSIMFSSSAYFFLCCRVVKISSDYLLF